MREETAESVSSGAVGPGTAAIRQMEGQRLFIANLKGVLLSKTYQEKEKMIVSHYACYRHGMRSVPSEGIGDWALA
jgi:hypothetical protein